MARLTVLQEPEGETPTVAWEARAQNPGGSWADSSWHSRSFRVLLKGDTITRTGSQVQLGLRGRSSGSYTVQRVSLVRREGNTVNGVDSTYTEVTFGGSWDNGVTIPPDDTVTSDPLPFDLIAGEDVFLTYWVPSGQPAVFRNGGTTTSAWIITGTDQSATLDWENLSISEARSHIYILDRLEVVSGGGETPPTITTQPADVSVNEPASATFTVEATGDTPLRYQWKRAGVEIAGATSASYTLNPTTNGDSGATFAVVVSNAAGSVTSANATLTVETALVESIRMNFQPTNAPVPVGYAVDDGSVYLASRGYGWDSAVDSRDRHENGDQRLDTFVFSHGATWRYDLPNGEYLVTLVSGDAGYGRTQEVVVEGTLLIDQISMAANEFVTVTDVPVTVADGSLTIDLSPSGGGDLLTTLNYVIITPVSGQVTSLTPVIELVPLASSGPKPLEINTLTDNSSLNPGRNFALQSEARPRPGSTEYAKTGDENTPATTEDARHDSRIHALVKQKPPPSKSKKKVAWVNPFSVKTTFPSRDYPGPTSHGSPWAFALPAREISLFPIVQGGAQPSPTTLGSIHLAAFRPQASTVSTSIDQVRETQAAKQDQLDEVLVRTQASPLDETVTTFVYDGNGERVMKTVTTPSHPDQVTIYIGKHYVCQGTDVNNLSCAKFIFANGQRIAMAQVENPTSVTFFHSDHLGSASLVTDENGAVEQELAYYPFGDTQVNSSTQNVDVAYKYTGKERDSSTGLYDYHARLYDPYLGRFISPDVLVPNPGNPQDLNRYSYVRNNPLLYVDPNGEFAVTTATLLYFGGKFLYGSFVGGTSAAALTIAQNQTENKIYLNASTGAILGGLAGIIAPSASQTVGVNSPKVIQAIIGAVADLSGQVGSNIQSHGIENALSDINIGSIATSGISGPFANQASIHTAAKFTGLTSHYLGIKTTNIAASLVGDIPGNFVALGIGSGGAYLGGTFPFSPHVDASTWPPSLDFPGLYPRISPIYRKASLLSASFFDDRFDFTDYSLFNNNFSWSYNRYSDLFPPPLELKFSQ